MESLGNSTQWSSRDSLSYTPSLASSECDQTEDEGDSFSSEGESEGAHFPVGTNVTSILWSPESNDKKHAGHHPAAPSSSTPGPSEGDLAFAQKCSELQGFLRPLLELLNGLKMGKYDKGLSTFQQSVAIDRLQKIVGILQKPDRGEKYLPTLRQVEVMLKGWFPQVLVPHSITAMQKRPAGQHWHLDQMCIPVKKRRLSWSDPELPSPASPHYKRLQDGQPVETLRPASFKDGVSADATSWSKTMAANENCACGIPGSSNDATRGQKGVLSPLFFPYCSSGNSDTQDSSVSSTTPTSECPVPVSLKSQSVKIETSAGQNQHVKAQSGAPSNTA
ncbi:circadian associated repressor of transcription a [Denticeps clupeoides]|uniref:Circadian-associated transcriptional repressor-like n=1 Tax=Denticeps clupeoides TaxID=299321 RepID=A0AAY4DKV5_9TELE|nr:circadian-associated transcriptional repressor-like [Denticeps clupeoides]XP_028820012.1 circadian-associated transcriptional repressor-like [Denticeps clupeoides]